MLIGANDTIPNPFAVDLHPRRSATRRAFVSAAKMLIVVAACLAVTLLISSQSRRWLLNHYVQGFDRLDRTAQISRLTQIATLGRIAVPTLVDAITRSDDVVARSATELLDRMQDDWSLLSPAECLRHHETLIDAIAQAAPGIPTDRTLWATGLLQASLTGLPDLTSDDSRRLRRKAEIARDRLSPRTHDPSSTVADGLSSSIRIVAKTQPLPIDAQWHAAQTADEASGDIARRDHDRDTPDRSWATVADDAAPSDRGGVDPGDASIDAAIDRSLQTIDADTVRLSRVDVAVQPSAAAHHQTAEIQAAAHLLRSPLETLQTSSVIHFLADPDPSRSSQAAIELTRRRWDDRQIGLARRMVSGTTADRIEVIEAIGRSTSLDPRPWLILLIDDSDRQIRHRVVSILATMDDPEVRQRLRQHAEVEDDAAILALLDSDPPRR